jgi:hypothetical protein
MNSYDAYVTGMTIRRITVQAENQKAAEAEAMREFMALVGGTDDVEVVDIEIINDELFQADADIQKTLSKILTDEA